MSNTIFKKVDYDLSGLVKDIALGKIGLPDIQRPFVWPGAKVRDLFDSMYKGYPVGYLLFWENGLTSGARTIGSDSKQLSPDLVIVDGQQRLTSLYAVMNAAPVIGSNFQSRRIRLAFNPLKESFEVTNAPIEGDKSFLPDISKLWSAETNLFQVTDDYIKGLRSVREVSDDEVKSIQTSIVKLQGLSSFPFTALQLSPEASEEDIADVFVRINSQGKTLNQSDFILTLLSVFWDEGRANLERFYRESQAPSTGAPSSYNHFIEPTPDQMLRVGIGVAFKRARLASIYSILRGKDLETKEFSGERRTQQFERLKEGQSRALNLQYWHDFMQCVRRAGYRTKRMISSQNALLYSYIIYLLGRTEVRVDEPRLRAAISQWFFMSAITGRYTASGEPTMESDFAMLGSVTTADDFIAKLQQTCNLSLTNDYWEMTLPNELATSSSRSPSLFAYEASLVLLDAPALFSDFKVGDMMDPSVLAHRNAIERHHLFPSGFLTKVGLSQPRDQNQIANFAYVEWLDNVKISDQAPFEYLPLMEERFSQTQLARMYQAHALPDGWANLDYQEFLKQRRSLMAQTIREGYQTLALDSKAGEQPYEVDLAGIIGRGETDAVEFKSTLRVNLATKERDPRMEQAVLKTLAGFLNSSGGTLLIGVSDDGTSLGLQEDGFTSEDRMSLHLTIVVNNSMGPSTWSSIHANFDDYDGGRVLVVRCDKHRSPVYVKHGKEEDFYIRTGPSTIPLPVSQAQEYIKQQWG